MVVVRLEILVDQVDLTVLGLNALPGKRPSNRGDIEPPGRGMCETGETSFDRHRALVSRADPNGIQEI